jgi:predicted nucleotidyltransferase
MLGKTREGILNLLSQNKYQLENRFKVLQLALFGSFVRGDQPVDNDVYILVDIDPSVGATSIFSKKRYHV